MEIFVDRTKYNCAFNSPAMGYFFLRKRVSGFRLYNIKKNIRIFKYFVQMINYDTNESNIILRLLFINNGETKNRSRFFLSIVARQQLY